MNGYIIIKILFVINLGNYVFLKHQSNCRRLYNSFFCNEKLKVFQCDNVRLIDILSVSFKLVKQISDSFEIKCKGVRIRHIMIYDIFHAHPISFRGFRGNFEALTVSGPSKIKQLPAKMLERFPILKSLTLEQLSIKDVPDNVFEVCKSVTQIKFWKVSLKYLSDFCFVQCSKLIGLEISDGELIVLKNNYFMGLSQLKSLNLTRNSIQSIQSRVFERLFKLSKLDLSFNKIVHLSINSFNTNLNLVALILGHNKLNSTKFLMGSNNLKVLEFKNNKKIIDIDLLHFENLLHLQTVEFPTIKCINSSKNLKISQFTNAYLKHKLSEFRLCSQPNRKYKPRPFRPTSAFKGSTILVIKRNQVNLNCTIQMEYSSISKLVIIGASIVIIIFLSETILFVVYVTYVRKTVKQLVKIQTEKTKVKKKSVQINLDSEIKNDKVNTEKDAENDKVDTKKDAENLPKKKFDYIDQYDYLNISSI